ncbi:MAG: CBS domain-containing protein [Chloroflexota bacterium]
MYRLEATIRLLRVRGIDVGIHYSWFIVVVAFSWLLAEGQYPNLYEDWSTAQYWTVAVASVLLLFLSVLLHEFGHALVAQGRGVPVRSITLFIFGGIAGLARESDDSKDEFLIAIAGPIVSIALGGLFGLLWFVFAGVNVQVGALLGYLAYVNIVLAVFNMIPGFPLDGGRVLRAVIWRATGNLQRATDIAATIGTTIGMLFVFGGILVAISGPVVNGIWAIVIGWFLQNASQQSRSAVEEQVAFQDVRVRDLMNPVPVTVSPTVDLETLAEDYILRRNARGIPVVNDGRMIGLVTVSDLKNVNRQRWPVTHVADVMTPAPELHTIHPDSPIAEALNAMNEHEFHQIPVVEESHLVGMLTRFELIRYLHTRQELGHS